MTITEILDKWPSYRQLADDIGVTPQAVIKWKARQSIPAMYLRNIYEHSAKHGYGVTYKMLVEASAKE